jgi:hypothetical protein
MSSRSHFIPLQSGSFALAAFFAAMAESADIVFLPAQKWSLLPPSQSVMDKPEEKGHDLTSPILHRTSTNPLQVSLARTLLVERHHLSDMVMQHEALCAMGAKTTQVMSKFWSQIPWQ